MNSKAFLFALAVLFGLANAGCSKSASPEAGGDEKKPTVTVELATVKAEPTNDYVSLQGSFVPSAGGVAKLAPSIASKIGRVLVKEGELVRKGQVLVLLDPSVASAQQNSAQAAANAAKIQYQQSATNLQVTEADQHSTLETARIGLQQAHSEAASRVAQARYTLQQSEADLQKLRAGARPQEITQAHEATVQAMAAKNRAQSELDRDEALAVDGYIAKKQLEDARTAQQTTASALKAAQSNEQLVRAGARPEEIRSAESRTAAAQEALATSQQAAQLQVAVAEMAYSHAQSGNLQVKSKALDVASSQAAAAQKAADLAASQATLNLYRITAPFDGTIIKQLATAGDPADPQTTVIIIQKKESQTNFVAGGLPDQINSLTTGMETEVVAGDKTYSGQVLSISPGDLAGGPATVRIAIEGKAVPGVFGTARIIVQHHASMPTVPDTAIVEKDGKEVVFKNVNGVATRTEVKVGSELEGKTAIISGLKVGDSVVASGGNELDDGTKIAAASVATGDAKDKG